MNMMSTAIYTLGCGDRFEHQGEAQLSACIKAGMAGIDVFPVWNKSYREHMTVHTEPSSVRVEADAAVKALEWNQPYFVDADHINLSNVDGFIDSSDFFTIDVADYIGNAADGASIDNFIATMHEFVGKIQLPGVEEPLSVNSKELRSIFFKHEIPKSQER